MEQIIFDYNCGHGNSHATTKFVFQHDEDGKILAGEGFISTVGDDFEKPITEEEMTVFRIVDSDGKFSKITGFRKVKAGESHHGFPLIKNGYKLKIRF